MIHRRKMCVTQAESSPENNEVKLQNNTNCNTKGVIIILSENLYIFIGIFIRKISITEGGNNVA